MLESAGLRNMEHVGHSYEIVNGMPLDIMEISMTKSVLHSESKDLVPILHDCIETVFRFHEKCSTTFEYRLSSRCLAIVDESKLRRVMMNILDNARQAMRNSGSIAVETDDVSHGGVKLVQVTIRNSGSYIEPEDRAKLFTAFFTKGKAGGTGLGLAICKKVVEAHGGRIWCDSDQDSGTSFSFQVPAGGERLAEPLEFPKAAGDIYQRFLA